MRRSTIAVASAIALFAAACSDAGETEAVDPGRLVVWTGDSIGVLVEGEIGDIETSGTVSQVTAAADGTLVWSRFDRDSQSVGAVIDAETRSFIETPTVPFFYEWNPTGTRIAFLGNAPSGAGLLFGLIDVDAQDLMSVESPPPFFFDWSPDGDRLIAHIGGSQLRLIDADTGDVEAVRATSGAFPTPIWADRGIVVATDVGPTVSSLETLVSLQAARSEVVLIDPDDGSRTLLAELDEPVRFFSSETGLALVVGVENSQRIEVIDWDGTPRATLGEGTIDLAQWSPDGSMLMWTERGDDGTLSPMTWDGEETTGYSPFRPSTDFTTAYLPFWDQYDRTMWLWSPDSSAFSLPTREGIVVHALDGTSETYPGWDMAIWTTTPGDE